MLLFSFALGTVALILQSVLFSHFTLCAYAPWITLICLVCPLPKTLWLASFAGAIVDLLSEDPMGIHALNYTAVAALLFRYKKHFLYDNPLHFSLFSALVSFVSMLLQLFLCFLFDRRIPFTGQWIFADSLVMPVADGIYALFWFSAPLALWTKLLRWKLGNAP